MSAWVVVSAGAGALRARRSALRARSGQLKRGKALLATSDSASQLGATFGNGERT